MISSSGDRCIHTTVTRGGVSYKGDFYWDEKLLDVLGCEVWVGSKFSDPQRVEVFTGDRAFVCDAKKLRAFGLDTAKAHQ